MPLTEEALSRTMEEEFCDECKVMIDKWRHPAGHIIYFCRCASKDPMEKCSECGLWFNKSNKHPHKIYRPNLKLFMKWGYMSH